jgi:hypothetical protein
MPLDVSGFDAVLKEVYEKTIINLLNSRTKTLNMAKKETGSWEGRHVRYPLNIRRNQGVMATSENGTLPDAGAQAYAETQIPIRYQHGRIQLSIQVIKHSRSNRGAFKRAMDQEMLGLVRDLANDRNRQVYGFGSGALCRINEADPTTNTTLIVDSPGGVPGATHGNRFLNVGMNIAFINPATGAIRGAARAITAINTAGTEVTLGANPPATTADDDFVVRAAKTSTTVVGDTAYNKEPMGLLGLIDDSGYVAILHNITRATTPIFNSVIVGSVGPLSADILQRGLDVADQVGEGQVKYFLTHHSVRRAYLTLMEADRRYAGKDLMSPDAGTIAAKQKDITFGDVPWIVDKDAPYGTIFGLDPTTFTRWSEVEGEWADDDGTILLRLVDQDAYEARYRIFDNFSLDRPASCVRWDGVTASVVVAHIF